MREIKFRCWDKVEKMMLQSNGLGFKDRQLLVDSVDTLFDWDGEDFKDVSSRFEIMQYTGLKDKNGKEVWEGDIVKYKNHLDGEPEEISEVKYVTEYGEAYFCPFTTCGRCGDSFVDEDDVEVIGNIYENPELLK